MYRTVRLSLPLLLFIALVGCGPRNPNAPATVSGHVTYKGETLTAGTVKFHSKDKGIFEALIDAEGNFKAVDVPIGDMTVTVETESANPAKAKAPDYKGGFGGSPNDSKYGKGGGGKPSGQQKGSKKGAMTSPVPPGAETGAGKTGKYVKIPARYADPEKSKLSAKIVTGKNVGLKFELTD